ncbi:MAG: DUF3795 domain-containing protein [Bacillota bacterium]
MTGDDVWRLVTPCGLYCGACANRARIPAQAAALRSALRDEYWDEIGEGIFPGFARFLEILETFTDPDGACPGCREGGGNPECEVRRCSQERGLRTCSSCEDFPCPQLERIGRIYPVLLADAERLRSLGVEDWVREQESRVERGFVYSSIRCE